VVRVPFLNNGQKGHGIPWPWFGTTGRAGGLRGDPGSCFTATGRVRPGLTVGSTGSSRLRRTGGDGRGGPPGEVDRGVAVSVQDQATALAAVAPLREGELRFDRPAAGALLGTGEPPVGDHQLGAVPLALVGQLAAELREPGIRERSGQLAVAQHASDMEVFHHDPAVGLGQAGGELVEMVAAHVGDLGVVASQPAGGSGPIARATGLTGVHPGEVAELAQPPAQDRPTILPPRAALERILGTDP